eukprot:CAMPEP_0201117764 /NCGR_PEP_ID=MMETSP0850-20130426/1798_1 /ASSEMBLY_ACC=CAM_ASM_000622 /TAXON_ID=183588 /ORGANISM="Pseudo-nitzschia fraudulenta, Strain WWA7" /LENGTH=109 /DNA_ID=CAMNT_0047382379 /DNA_START=85 /DNA_END=414 /DNA_ORIENTATION=-
MAKKESATGRKRKMSNTTTQNDGAKRSKTEEMNSSAYRNGILQGIRALLGKMGDKELVAVMAFVSTMEEKQKSTTLQPLITVTTTATGSATATSTVNTPAAKAANFTTT